MILKASPSLSFHSPTTFNSSVNPTNSSSSSSSSFLRLMNIPIGRRGNIPIGRKGNIPSNGYKSIVAKADNDTGQKITGLVFEPFEELRHEPNLVPTFPDQSLARYKFTDDCEAAINQQINVEYNVSYIYHAMFAYFDRDNVALKGLAHFFKESSNEERKHAEKFMEYQNKRGGRVKLQSILMPLSEFEHPEKGDALYAMELALSLQKLTDEKLRNLRAVAEQCNDVQTMDFVDGNFLADQVKAIKMISEYVSQLRRVGKGHGVWHFNQMLLHDDGNGAA